MTDDFKDLFRKRIRLDNPIVQEGVTKDKFI